MNIKKLIEIFEKMDISKPFVYQPNIQKGAINVQDTEFSLIQMMFELKKDIGELSNSAKIKYLISLNLPMPEKIVFECDNDRLQQIQQSFFQVSNDWYDFIEGYKKHLNTNRMQTENDYINTMPDQFGFPYDTEKYRLFDLDFKVRVDLHSNEDENEYLQKRDKYNKGRLVLEFCEKFKAADKFTIIELLNEQYGYITLVNVPKDYWLDNIEIIISYHGLYNINELTKVTAVKKWIAEKRTELLEKKTSKDIIQITSEVVTSDIQTKTEKDKDIVNEYLKPLNGYRDRQKIMRLDEFERLIEYVFFMIESEKLPENIIKIPHTNHSTEFLRKTFQRLHKQLYGRKKRKYWIDFLHLTFVQFENWEITTTDKNFTTYRGNYEQDVKNITC